MPQFDIASFFPQITFFAGIFLIFYVFLSKNILPKISQNLKLNKRILDIYNALPAFRGHASVSGQSSHNVDGLPGLARIYNPSKILAFAVYKETICLIYLRKMVRLLTISYMSSLNWLINVNKNDSQVKLAKLNLVYLYTINDCFGGVGQDRVK